MSSAIDDPEVTGETSETQPEAPQQPASAWGDRLRALRNVPPVLHFVWESGPAVVFWNIAIRVIVAFLPVGIGIIGRFIIDGVNRIRMHQPLPQHFWWLVAAEMALAVITGILSRSVDYFDNLLADRYTHHVSVEVMRKAAALDVTVYEDPVFYDRLERARVQATDRLAMIQQMGRLIQQIGHGHRVFRGARSSTLPSFFCCWSPASFPHSWAKAISRFSPMPRTSARRPCAAKWITCARWAAAKKRPRNSSSST